MNMNQRPIIIARGGGGGSSSGGGGGGGGGSHSSSSSSSYSSSSSSSGSGSSSPADAWFGIIFMLIFFGVWALVIVLIIRAARKGVGGGIPAGYIDPSKSGTDEEKKLAKQVNDTFFGFQKGWSEFDAKAMQQLCSTEYSKRMILELGVLRNYKRRDQMDDCQLTAVYLKKADDYSKGFEVQIRASATDKLIDEAEKKTLFTDNSPWVEYWQFVCEGGSYKLDLIRQDTEDASKYDAGIAEFAAKQGFYYDPDFGWLMMPTRGAIFGPAGFGNADINNHVIGSVGSANRQKIVEFYSYEPKAGAGMSPITVAQAILPKKYDDILVTEKSWYDFKPKLKGLEKVETESVDFNKKFSVWAAQPDRATSFELLATNFMERIYKLDFEVNIEVVDNVLYLYSPDNKLNYDEMLEVLSWAFDEMKL